MMEKVFGNATIEKVLFYTLKNGTCYPSELQKIFQRPLSSFQRALARLEKGGVLVSFSEGKTVLYEFNPRYPFLQELKALLEKAYSFLPKDVQTKFYALVMRKRPRRRGKPL